MDLTPKKELIALHSAYVRACGNTQVEAAAYLTLAHVLMGFNDLDNLRREISRGVAEGIDTSTDGGMEWLKGLVGR